MAVIFLTKRLIKKSFNTNNCIGKDIEIIHQKSKYFGCKGKIEQLTNTGKFKIVFYSPTHDDVRKLFIRENDINKWVRIIQHDQDKYEDERLIFL